MNKRVGKRIFVGLFLAVLIVSILGFVVAADETTVIGQFTAKILPNGGTGLNNFLNNGAQIQDSLSFVRVLIFILVFLIIFSIFEFLPLFGHNIYVKWGISIIVSLLSTMFLSNEEISTVLLSYGALGIALTAIIPFICIAAISKKLHDEEGYAFWGKVLWLGFLVFLVFRWLLAPASQIGDFGKWAFPIVFLLALAMFLWENRIYLILFRQQMRQYADSSREESIANISADLRRMGNRIEDTTDNNVRARLISQYNKKAETLRSFGVKWPNLVA
ncbi:MAG: hypothetical protein Q7S56_00990 [Nanoarchaeota archaeon]|nr:hypothetical protein [Nanoarchaeota archaeon]